MGEVRRNKRARREAAGPAVVTGKPKPREAGWDSRAVWIAVGLILINVLVYAPLRHYDFVSFDDPQYVQDNPDISAGLTLHGIQWALTTGHASNWHPLTWISHMLDISMFGVNAGPHHVVNILFHIANTVLLFALLFKMTGALGRSGFVAGLFAVHPLHVESVAWISERKDVLSTLLWILTIWAYVTYVRQPKAGRYAVVAVMFALGLMAKPMLVTLPFVLVLLDYWQLERMELEASSIVKSLTEKAPLIGLAVISSIITFAVQFSGAVSGLDAVPVGLRIANAAVAYVAYMNKMLFPVGLTALYPLPRSISAGVVVGAIAVLAGISYAGFRYGKERRYIPVGWLWYLGTLVPVIGIVQVGAQSMADRYSYVPLVGLFIIIAWGISDLAARAGMKPPALAAAAVVLIGTCAWGASQQVPYWKDSATLWTRALAVTSENFRAQTALGSLLHADGKVAEAIPHYTEAVRIRPEYAEAHLKLGAALADQGKTTEAIPQLQEALRLKPDLADAHNNLGNAAARLGKLDEAIGHYKEAIRLDPKDAQAHNGLGSVLDDKGQLNEAVAEYNEALRLKPELAVAHNNMAATLMKQSKIDEAIREMREAVRIQPNSADFQYNLGMLLQQRGQTAEAREHLDAAARNR